MTRKFQLNDRVRKTQGSSWQGRVCGLYATTLTPYGYCVESERELHSVQIYPEAALQAVPEEVPPWKEAGDQLVGVKAQLDAARALLASLTKENP